MWVSGVPGCYSFWRVECSFVRSYFHVGLRYWGCNLRVCRGFRVNLFLMKSSLDLNRQVAPHRRRSLRPTHTVHVSQHWGVEFTRTWNALCKWELARDLPSKAEATAPRKLLQTEFGRSCVGEKPTMHSMDGLRSDTYSLSMPQISQFAKQCHVGGCWYAFVGCLYHNICLQIRTMYRPLRIHGLFSSYRTLAFQNFQFSHFYMLSVDSFSILSWPFQDLKDMINVNVTRSSC